MSPVAFTVFLIGVLVFAAVVAVDRCCRFRCSICDREFRTHHGVEDHLVERHWKAPLG